MHLATACYYTSQALRKVRTDGCRIVFPRAECMLFFISFPRCVTATRAKCVVWRKAISAQQCGDWFIIRHWSGRGTPPNTSKDFLPVTNDFHPWVVWTEPVLFLNSEIVTKRLRTYHDCWSQHVFILEITSLKSHLRFLLRCIEELISDQSSVTKKKRKKEALASKAVCVTLF